MSTRCQIGFYEHFPHSLPDPVVMIYQHSDGNPERMLPKLSEFLKSFEKRRGYDVGEVSARLLSYLVAEHDAITASVYVGLTSPNRALDPQHPEFGGTNGFALGLGLHGDEDYYYAISSDRVAAFTVKEHSEGEATLRLLAVSTPSQNATVTVGDVQEWTWLL
jgi:hypothetical protein